MIKCEWLFCKYNKMSEICNCKKDISLRCATVEDLINESIITEITKLSDENSANVLICDNYETMD